VTHSRSDDAIHQATGVGDDEIPRTTQVSSTLATMSTCSVLDPSWRDAAKPHRVSPYAKYCAEDGMVTIGTGDLGSRAVGGAAWCLSRRLVIAKKVGSPTAAWASGMTATSNPGSDRPVYPAHGGHSRFSCSRGVRQLPSPWEGGASLKTAAEVVGRWWGKPHSLRGRRPRAATVG